MTILWTTDQLRSLAQAEFDDYNDGHITKEQLFKNLHYPLWLCSGRFVATKDTAFIDLSNDIGGLIQDIANN